MAGGFALLKDVYKTDVWRLARHLNERAGRELIPESIDRAGAVGRAARGPARRGSLPPYAMLDRVLEAYVELDRSREELLSDGFDAGRRRARARDVDRAEYKRRQAPPGVKLRPKAFGRDRRTPITNPVGIGGPRDGAASGARGTSEAAPHTERPRSPATSRAGRTGERLASRRSCRPWSGRSPNGPRYASLPTKAISRGRARRAIRSSRSAEPAKSPRRRSRRARRRPQAALVRP